MTEQPTIKTLGELKASGYQHKSVKDELRDNLINTIKDGSDYLNGIKGYENTVIPQLESAILSKHNVIFLGLRGQAKTKMARLMTNLLDEYIPVIEGTDLNDDPFNPLSIQARMILEEKGDDTPIAWIHKSERYSEKLATPDVSVSDLIGDLDPIKAATQKLTYADERVIHFGMIPRANRGIFVINELPDLQARIQVGLFNILEEGDIQIRGFKLRMPLDIQFVFTANPEDYTNRGSIVTPLKDRIESQILTHYPSTIELSRAITQQEARISEFQKEHIKAPDLVVDLLETVAFEARNSEYVDQKSGVSARLTISAYENMFSVAERRLLRNKEKETTLRISDIFGIIPSITGKIELVYEGELEGPGNVAMFLIGKAIRSIFEEKFPNPEKLKKLKESGDIYLKVVDWFRKGKQIEILQDFSGKQYQQTLNSVPGLAALVKDVYPDVSPEDQFLLMEFVLHGLAEFSQISKHKLDEGSQFKDLMSSMLDIENMNFEDEIEDDY